MPDINNNTSKPKIGEKTHRIVGPENAIVISDDSSSAIFELCWMIETTEVISHCETKVTNEKRCEWFEYDGADKCKVCNDYVSYFSDEPFYADDDYSSDSGYKKYYVDKETQTVEISGETYNVENGHIIIDDEIIPVQNDKKISGETLIEFDDDSEPIRATYTIIHTCHECDKDCKTDESQYRNCSIGNVWASKKDGYITVFYEQFNVEEYDNYSELTKVVSSHTEPMEACDGEKHTIEFDATWGEQESCITCGTVSYTYSCTDDKCTSGTSVVIGGVSFSPSAVEYSGGTVYVSMACEIITLNEDCTRTVNKRTISIPVEIGECSGVIECCNEHLEEISIPSSNIIEALTEVYPDLPEDVKILYNGKVISDNLVLNITQKAKIGGDCDSDCEYHTTYCVKNNSVKVEYETYWGSNIWVGYAKVPSNGGRVKISWDYVATNVPEAPSDLCKEYIENGSDYIIVEIDACTSAGDTCECSDSLVFMGGTRRASASSDIRTLTGEILYKEQTPGCDFSSTTYHDHITGKDIIMNLITYVVEQDCSMQCVPHTRREFNKITVSAGGCDTSVSGIVPYVDITVNEMCEETRVAGSAMYTDEINTYGCSGGTNRRRFETEHFIVEQTCDDSCGGGGDCTIYSDKTELDHNGGTANFWVDSDTPDECTVYSEKDELESTGGSVDFWVDEENTP